MGRVRPRYYTTPSTVPESVRPSLWKDWQRFWARLRRMSERDRELEFRSGTALTVEGIRYSIRYGTGRFHMRLPLSGREVAVRGSLAFGSGKPYVYADELQDALDSLAVQSVMES